MEERATFKFFRSFRDAAKQISDKNDRCDYYDSICDYALDGIEPEVSGVCAAMFLLTKPNIDASLKKAQAGALGGKASPRQTASKPEAHAKQTAREVGGRKKEDRSREDTPLTPQGAGGQTREQTFEAFWALYPKKKSKGRAKTVWDKLDPSGEIIRAIMEKLPLLMASEEWTKDGGRYIPYPATWLNAEGWNDEIVNKNASSLSPEASGYHPGESELRSIANLQRLRDSLAQGDGP